MNELEKLTQLAEKYNVLSVAKPLIKNPKFAQWSGSSKPFQHHYGKGGLIRHTLEVVELCIQINEYYGNPVNTGHLVLAAMYHDAGKMFDYTPVDNELKEWAGNEHKRKIHHISRSSIYFSKIAEYRGLSSEITDEIIHAILSHHGNREWGSPVYPATKMAWILHLCDGLSARIDD